MSFYKELYPSKFGTSTIISDNGDYDKKILLKEVVVKAYREYKVALDPGHGIGKADDRIDSGTSDTIHLEKDYTLIIAKATYTWLRFFDLSAFLTREGDKTTSENQVNYRWKEANKRNSKVLVSFHLDSTSTRKAFAGYEGGMDNQENSIKLAKSILSSLHDFFSTSKDEVYKASSPKFGVNSFGVLRNFKGIAGILIEFGGIGSEENRKIIKSNKSKIGFWIAYNIYWFLNNSDPKVFQTKFTFNNQNETYGKVLKKWAKVKE